MEKTRLSSKGQVIIPRGIRRARGWKPGLQLAVEDTEVGVLLRPVHPFAATTIEEVLGCAEYEGPARSLAEMDEAVARAAREARR